MFDSKNVKDLKIEIKELNDIITNFRDVEADCNTKISRLAIEHKLKIDDLLLRYTIENNSLRSKIKELEADFNDRCYA